MRIKDTGDARRAQAAQFPRPPRDLRPKILDERLSELEISVRGLEKILLSADLLTPQQSTVLRMTAEGYQVREIAETIRRSVQQVGWIKARLHERFRTGGSNVRLMKAAAAAGVIPPPEENPEHEAIGRAVTRLFRPDARPIVVTYDGKSYEVWAIVSKTPPEDPPAED